MTAATRPASVRSALTADAIAEALLDNLHYLVARTPQQATRNDWYMALAYTVRDRLLHGYIDTVEAIASREGAVKVVAYLSAEFLTGPHLGNGLIALGIQEQVRQAVSSVGQDLDDLLQQEEEPGLGNGGLGRLAACYMDSLATLDIPAIGYGIRYEFGIFDQAIRDGWQVELTDKWLRFGNPWEIVRSEVTCEVKFGGRTEAWTDDKGRYRARWLPQWVVKGIACDTPVPGYRTRTTNMLRLWKAEATESFDLDAFNLGDYYRAVAQKVASETISKVLYPNDEPEAGKQLRLEQQVLFRVVLPPGHDPAAPAAREGARRVRRLLGRTAERHAPFDRGRRVDAAARGRARAGLGCRVGHHGTDVRLHEPHPAFRSARKMAAAAVRHGAATPSRDHLRDQPSLPR